MSSPEYQSINEIIINEDIINDFAVLNQGIYLNCKLNQKVRNDYLMVTCQGAVDRAKSELPVYARWNWHGIFNSTILSISDPALYMSDDIPIGWYAGTKYIDTTTFIADVVKKVAGLLGIPHSRIVFWGSSAGGYASVLLASRISGAKFVCVNGQTEIIKFHPWHIECFRKVFDPSSTAKELAKTFPEQWSTIEALKASYSKGNTVNGVMVQNTIDEMHYENHYTPFCKQFNLPIEGGCNSSLGLYSMLYSSDLGHGPEPGSVAREIVQDYLPKLLG